MQAHEELVRCEIEKCSGQEVKTIGDSFMVTFGSARSAVECAVAVQHALTEHNRDNPDDQIQVRIGLNTGEAIQEKGDLYGAAVDAAAKIMAKSAGGQILISETVRNVIGSAHEITLADRGPFWLKGFPHRWRLFEVLWQEEETSTIPAPPHIAERTPFVGRESERADLRRFLERARSGHGSLAMIGGEPGVGKTRITEELVAEARRHGFLTLTGHCYEMEGAPPYIPFVEIIESAVRIVEPDALLSALGDSAPEVAKLMPELRHTFPDIPTPPQLPPEQERRRMFNGVLSFISRASQAQPLLIVLEDLHWTDDPSLLLLQHFANRLHDMPVLLFGTYRDTELDVAPSLAKTLEDLLRQRLAHDVLLRRLSEDGVTAMLRGRSGQEPPTRLVKSIYKETEGIPFFVEEVFKHFAEEGRLFDAKGQWQTNLEIDELDVPRGVLLVIGHRLERVSEECRRILARAAVIGRGVSFGLLNLVIELDEDTLFDAIEEGERARLIATVTRQGEDRITFAHEYIRQTLLNGLSTPRQRRLHLRTAEAIEKLYAGTLQQHAADLAYHFYQTGDNPEKIIKYSVLAAERSTAQTAYEDAVEQYQRALRALELHKPVDQLRQCDLLLALGHAYGNTGDPDHAKETFFRVVRIARKLPAPEHFAEAVLGICRFLWGAGFIDNRILDLMEEGLTLLGEQDSALRASLLGRLVWFLESTGEERRIVLGEQAVAMARRVGDSKALYYALWGRAFTCDLPLAERIGAATELAELEKSIVLPDVVQHRGLFFLAHLHRTKGDIVASDVALAAVRKLATETSHPLTTYLVACAEYMQAVMLGQFEEAERLALEAFALGQKVNKEFAAQNLGGAMFLLRWLQGRLAEIDGMFRSQIEQYASAPLYRATSAQLHLMMGREEQAREELEHLGANEFADLPRDWSMPLLLVQLSEVAVALNDNRWSNLLYDLMHPLGNYLVMFGSNNACLGATTLWLGMLAGSLKRWDDAAAHFEAAIETNARVGARPFLARSQHEYARMLIERNESDDREKAKTLLTEATATYQELGMPTFLENAEELLAEL
jgi:tetratricopeptide (TPR) repeat protein